MPIQGVGGFIKAAQYIVLRLRGGMPAAAQSEQARPSGTIFSPTGETHEKVWAELLTYAAHHSHLGESIRAFYVHAINPRDMLKTRRGSCPHVRNK